MNTPKGHYFANGSNILMLYTIQVIYYIINWTRLKPFTLRKIVPYKGGLKWCQMVIMATFNGPYKGSH